MSAFDSDDRAATPATGPTDGEPAGTAPGRHDPSGDGGPGDTRPGPRAVPRTRTGGLWVAVAAFGVVLLFLLIFILQNLQVASVHFLGARWRLPVGAALLLAAVLGILLAAMAGTARIIQLRLLARRRATRSPAPPPDVTGGPGGTSALPEEPVSGAPDEPGRTTR